MAILLNVKQGGEKGADLQPYKRRSLAHSGDMIKVFDFIHAGFEIEKEIIADKPFGA